MDRNSLLNELKTVLSEIIDNEDLALTEESSPKTVEDWDSLAHFQFVMELQNQYGIKFLSTEIQSWKNVGDIIDSILAKI